MTTQRLPATLAALALTSLAAAPLKQSQETLFPWWETLLILLLVILLTAVLILWNASQPLEYADNLTHDTEAGHEHGSHESSSTNPDERDAH